MAEYNVDHVVPALPGRRRGLLLRNGRRVLIASGRLNCAGAGGEHLGGPGDPPDAQFDRPGDPSIQSDHQTTTIQTKGTTMSKHRRKAPPGYAVLRGEFSPSGKSIEVFCPFCDATHTHGWHPENPPWAVEMRGPHCHSQMSPFACGGSYFIGRLLPEHRPLSEQQVKRLGRRR